MTGSLHASQHRGTSALLGPFGHACAIAAVAASSCVSADGADADLGPVEATLSDDDRTAWPGAEGAGGRVVPLRNGFHDEAQAAWWDFGSAPRGTADSFWFCREDDDLCPLDENRRLNWDRAVGNPLVTRLPGDAEFSPYWQVWVARVPDDYAGNEITTAATLHARAEAGEIEAAPLRIDFGAPQGRDVGVRDVVVHFPLVLDGTVLEGNGRAMVGDAAMPSMFVETRQAWFEGYRVSLLDFSRSEGVLPAADDSQGRPMTPFSDAFVLYRDCRAEPLPELCSGAAEIRRAVEEGPDLTGDGDTRDTNTLLASLPGRPAKDGGAPYSPLQRDLAAEVEAARDAEVALIDRTGDDSSSDVRSLATLLAAIDAGRFCEIAAAAEDSLAERSVQVPAGFVP